MLQWHSIRRCGIAHGCKTIHAYYLILLLRLPSLLHRVRPACFSASSVFVSDHIIVSPSEGNISCINRPSRLGRPETRTGNSCRGNPAAPCNPHEEAADGVTSTPCSSMSSAFKMTPAPLPLYEQKKSTNPDLGWAVLQRLAWFGETT
jgi:hypothetical protein